MAAARDREAQSLKVNSLPDLVKSRACHLSRCRG